MIVFASSTLVLGETTEQIVKWEVWFHTPWGLCKTMQQAIRACADADLDPDQAIVPITVAVGETIYEAYYRG